MLVKQREDNGLVNVDLHKVFLGEVICLDLKVAVTKEPMKLSATEFFGVEVLENLLDLTHNWRNFACRDILIGPMTAGEDFHRKINTINNGSAASSRLEIIIKTLGFNHVLKHSFNLVDRVITTLNGKFIDHLLLSPIRQRGLIKKSLSQKVAILCDEDITPMEAAEQSDDGIEFFALLLFSDLLESSFELIIKVECDKMWCLLIAIHKVHESLISCTLEPHVLVE